MKTAKERREYGRQWHQENRETIAERKRIYRRNNREACAKRQRKYYANNRKVVAERKRKHRENNRELIAEQERNLYEKHREAILARARKHRSNNRDILAERWRAYSEKNREILAEQRRVAYKKNPETKKAHARNRQARVKGAEGKHTAAEIRAIWKQQRHKCAVPNCPYPIASSGKHIYEIDHVKALANGGSNRKHNLIILCATHNSQKGKKDEFKWANSLGLLFV